MMIKGKVETEDFFAFSARAQKSGSKTNTRIILIYLCFCAVLAVLLARICALKAGTNFAIIHFCAHLLVLFGLIKVLHFFNKKVYRKQKLTLVGDNEYYLEESHMRQDGPVINTTILYSKMCGLVVEDNTAYVDLGLNFGIILPRRENVTEGDFDRFLMELQRRIDAAQENITDSENEKDVQ